jgi:DNA-binding NtrC family response regulator
MLVRVLLALREEPVRRKLRAALVQEDVVVDSVRGRDRLWERLSQESADLIVVGRSVVPEPVEETLRTFHNLPEAPDLVILSEEEDARERARLLAAGCSAVINPRLAAETLRDVLTAISAKRSEAVDQVVTARRDIDEPRLSDFVSISPAMRSFMDVVERIVGSNSSLLILGETGVGKERLARAVHAEGPRSSGPFIAVNCGALPENLLESEMFGHEEGAFTGATRSRRGCFELAHGGTLFLDEIGEMPGHLQVKLLRVLQDHEIQRVGGEKVVAVDVRVMAASNRDLAAEVEAGGFRKDLYYRLGVVTLTIPPLRERREDIAVLAQSYVEYLRPRVGVDVRGISEAALEAMIGYPWPGNVRELVNVVERGMLLCRSDQISCEDLPEAVAGTPESVVLAVRPGADGAEAIPVPAHWLEQPWKQVRGKVLGNLERAYFEGLLSSTGGRIGETARKAGIEPRSLFEKMRRHGLRKEKYRVRAERND